MATETMTLGHSRMILDASVTVFDRWGRKIRYFTRSAGRNNGRECPTADYYYVIDLGNGQTYNGVPKKMIFLNSTIKPTTMKTRIFLFFTFISFTSQVPTTYLHGPSAGGLLMGMPMMNLKWQ